jgi:hypothetical protein
MEQQTSFCLERFLKFHEDIPVKTVAYFIWKNPYMVAGSDNFINELLKLNHFKTSTIKEDIRGRNRKIQQEGNPDLILLSSEPFPFKEDGYMKSVI